MPIRILRTSLLAFALLLGSRFFSSGQPLPNAWSMRQLQWGAGRTTADLKGFRGIHWNLEGHLFTRLEMTDGKPSIIQYDPGAGFSRQVLASSEDLTPRDSARALHIESYCWYPGHRILLLFTNSKKVWRAHTRGDFWVLNTVTKKLFQLGRGLPASSLQFAKIAPDGTKAAYVSGHNIYVQDLISGRRSKLTRDGTFTIINGTFDWAYEEELFCRDGFRWSPDSRSIAYWQINASKIRDYLMLNTTDSVYSFTIPVQYPKVGYNPSSARIGIVNLATARTRWMHIPGDPVQHYLPRMAWMQDGGNLIVQQLNRAQDSSRIFLVNAATGKARAIYQEGDSSWIDLNYFWQYDRPGWDWIHQGRQFLWTTEKDGWRHVYRLDRDGTHEVLLTPGNYDVMDLVGIDQQEDRLYFTASPHNALQEYLYSVPLDGSGIRKRLTPLTDTGTNNYNFSPDGKFCIHTFSNSDTPPLVQFLDMDHDQVLQQGPEYPLKPELIHRLTRNPKSFFQVTTSEGVTMDGYMIRPADFDSTRKYPVLFYVYGEPAAVTVRDVFSPNPWFQELADAGYVIISMDNRGTPAPRGAAWRHAIYRHIGTLNMHDQALAAMQVLRWPWVDTSRIAVWGWSGGGSSTQNLMFQYPQIYKTGLAVAGVSNLLYYDDIYEERYMGLLPRDLKYYQAGSSVNHASGLRGHLLIVHGSGDDNVHYQNQEALINALVAAGKQFQMMEYPNRTHAISEGKGTTRHLYTLLTDFLETNCPPGPR